MKVFWDTNLFIYLIERHPDFEPQVRALLTCHRQQGDEIVTSTLTLGELLAQPLRQGRADLAQRYTELLTASAGVTLVTFDRHAAVAYAEIRASTSIRQPDAIQLACAVAAGAARFVTNDQRLWGVTVPNIQTIGGP